MGDKNIKLMQTALLGHLPTLSNTYRPLLKRRLSQRVPQDKLHEYSFHVYCMQLLKPQLKVVYYMTYITLSNAASFSSDIIFNGQ